MLIFAHRGASCDAPENTIAAIKEAITQKADGIEIDVRLSLDNKVTVCHDKTLLRLAGINGKIAEYSQDQLKKIDVGIYKGSPFRGENIPFLEEVLDATPRGILLQIDVKSNEKSVPFIINTINNGRKKLSEIIIISSRLRVLEAVRTRSNKIFTAWVYGMRPFLQKSLPGINSLIFKLQKAGAGAIDFDCRFRIDKKYMDLLRKNGIKAYAWTVDDENIALRLQDLGVEAIATNKPAFIKHAIEKHNRVMYEENKRS